MILLDSGLIIGLGIMLIAMIPSILLLMQYRKYRIDESLLFAGYFFIGSITLIIHAFSVVLNSLLLIKLTYIGFNSTYFFLLLYAVRIKWNFKISNRPQQIIWYLGVIWYLVMNLNIIFWTRFAQPEYTQFLFFDIPRVNRVFSIPHGAGFKINGFIIYGSHYDFPSILFSIYSQGIVIYNYVTLKLFQPTNRTIRARKLWLLAFFFGIIFSILSLPYPNASEYTARIFMFIGIIIVLYICLKIPEGLLLSKVQILRATKLYEILLKSGDVTMHEEPTQTTEYLINYLLHAQKIIQQIDSPDIMN